MEIESRKETAHELVLDVFMNGECCPKEKHSKVIEKTTRVAKESLENVVSEMPSQFETDDKDKSRSVNSNCSFETDSDNGYMCNSGRSLEKVSEMFDNVETDVKTNVEENENDGGHVFVDVFSGSCFSKTETHFNKWCRVSEINDGRVLEFKMFMRIMLKHHVLFKQSHDIVPFKWLSLVSFIELTSAMLELWMPVCNDMLSNAKDAKVPADVFPDISESKKEIKQNNFELYFQEMERVFAIWKHFMTGDSDKTYTRFVRWFDDFKKRDTFVDDMFLGLNKTNVQQDRLKQIIQIKFMSVRLRRLTKMYNDKTY